jgi:hypothetical protein
MMRPEADWLPRALQELDGAATALDRARGGPLGLLGSMSDRTEILRSEPAPAPAAAIHVPVPDNGTPAVSPGRSVGRLPASFLLQVDGVGSFLVAREPVVTIGPAGAAGRPDVALLADSTMPVATIERADDDYFVQSDRPLRVNDAPTTRRLLADGDRIALSPRCRLRFALPNAASTTGVIHLGGARLPRGDARRIILLDGSVIIGPGSSAHVRADALPEPVILQVRDGRLFPRTGLEVTVDDRPMDRNAGIPMGARVKIGPLSCVVTPVSI